MISQMQNMLVQRRGWAGDPKSLVILAMKIKHECDQITVEGYWGACQSLTLFLTIRTNLHYEKNICKVVSI